MAIRVEFDPSNRILLVRFDAQLTDDSMAEFYRVIRKHWAGTDASMGIVDFSSVTDFALSNSLIRELARREPCMPDAITRPRVIVAAKTHVFGLGRMFQILGETTRPLLTVVYTLDEALAEFGVQSPHFEPLE